MNQGCFIRFNCCHGDLKNYHNRFINNTFCCPLISISSSCHNSLILGQSGQIQGQQCYLTAPFFIRFGSTPLHQAAYFGHFDCAAVLLASGALANVEEAWGQTPLFLASQRAHRLVK